MDSLRLDLAYAVRAWRRHPAASLAAVLALAIGIGANTTVFSAVAGVLLKPLPYPEPDNLVMLWQDRSALGGPAREVISPGLFVDWSTRATAVTEHVAVVRGWAPNLTFDTGVADTPERLSGAAVSSAYFTLLGVAPALGRALSDADDRPGAAPVAVLSERLWRRRFASDRSIVGRHVQLDGQPVEVIGVMPASFQGAVIDAEIWTATRIDPANAPRGMVFLRALARLAPGISVAQAQSAFDALQARLQTADPELEGARARVVRLHDDVVGPVKPVLIVLAVSVGMVLLIACANVSSILVARAIDRRSELTTRIALGAGQGRIVRQLLTESAALALVGSVGGLGLAFAGVRAMVAVAPPSAPRLADITLDVPVLLFMAVATGMAALLSGLAPVVFAIRSRHVHDDREVTGHGVVRGALVAAEVAGALVLVIGAALFMKTLGHLQAVDLGFRTDGLLTASVSLPRSTYRTEEALRDVWARLLDRVHAIPGVQQAAVTAVLPLSGTHLTYTFSIEGQPRPRTLSDEPVAEFRSVSPAYFDALDMRLVEGRMLSADDRADSPAVLVVNETLATRHWPSGSPVGSRISLGDAPATIVGVVSDIHHEGPSSPPAGEMYGSLAQHPPRAATIVLRSSGDPLALTSELRAAVRDIDPFLPVAAIRPLAQLAADEIAQPRFLAYLLAWFSVAASALALVGVYGLLAFTVNRRVREIGVRMALGASPRAVMALVLKQSLLPVCLGLMAGAGGGVVLSRAASALLFGVEPGDPAIVAGTATLILMAATAASAIPARSAARVDPVSALRSEQGTRSDR